MFYMHEETKEYPLDEQQLKSRHPNCIFPIPFEAPDGYVYVEQANVPFFDEYTSKLKALEPVKVDGVYVQGWEIVDLSAAELAELEAQKAAEISRVRNAIEEWRDREENSAIIFSHAGRNWDGGLVTRTRMQPIINLPSLPPGFFWTDADNNDVPVSLEDMSALNAAHEAALVARGFEIHQRQRAMKEAAATMTLKDLRAFTPGWPVQPA